ncbi:MAG: hypothetical protein M1818_000819 [Claussenomyces sp. TS43310]|nr:MAG: hypothetical protein M1818_000819 [Claussenomyces sp. TS43310]
MCVIHPIVYSCGHIERPRAECKHRNGGLWDWLGNPKPCDLIVFRRQKQDYLCSKCSADGNFLNLRGGDFAGQNLNKQAHTLANPRTDQKSSTSSIDDIMMLMISNEAFLRKRSLEIKAYESLPMRNFTKDIQMQYRINDEFLTRRAKQRSFKRQHTSEPQLYQLYLDDVNRHQQAKLALSELVEVLPTPQGSIYEPSRGFTIDAVEPLLHCRESAKEAQGIERHWENLPSYVSHRSRQVFSLDQSSASMGQSKRRALIPSVQLANVSASLSPMADLYREIDDMTRVVEETANDDQMQQGHGHCISPSDDGIRSEGLLANANTGVGQLSPAKAMTSDDAGEQQCQETSIEVVSDDWDAADIYIAYDAGAPNPETDRDRSGLAQAEEHSLSKSLTEWNPSIGLRPEAFVPKDIQEAQSHSSPLRISSTPDASHILRQERRRLHVYEKKQAREPTAGLPTFQPLYKQNRADLIRLDSIEGRLVLSEIKEYLSIPADWAPRRLYQYALRNRILWDDIALSDHSFRHSTSHFYRCSPKTSKMLDPGFCLPTKVSIESTAARAEFLNSWYELDWKSVDPAFASSFSDDSDEDDISPESSDYEEDEGRPISPVSPVSAISDKGHDLGGQQDGAPPISPVSSASDIGFYSDEDVILVDAETSLGAELLGRICYYFQIPPDLNAQQISSFLDDHQMFLQCVRSGVIGLPERQPCENALENGPPQTKEQSQQLAREELLDAIRRIDWEEVDSAPISSMALENHPLFERPVSAGGIYRNPGADPVDFW